MPLSTQPYKGARDFYPEDKRFQKYLFGVMRGAVESYGYEEYDAPLLEPLDLYRAKSGEEIVSEQTYAFVDRGDREVAIRPEMTPTVSRMVAAKRQELAYPLRWYSIPNLWRYERPQRGRLREHWQLNVDIFGVASMEADAEIIHVADSIMQAFGAKRHMYVISVSSRMLIDSVMREYLQLNEVQAQMMMKLIDRMHKMPHAEFTAQAEAIFSPSQRETDLPAKLSEILAVKDLNELPEDLYKHTAVTELKQLMTALHKSGVTNAQFDMSIMRGFDYYTGTVFEIADTDPENNRSMFGGGRYDGLVGLYGVEPVPTVGFGVGDVTLANFLKTHELMPRLRPETDIYVVLAGDVLNEARKAIRDLREMGLNVAVDLSGRKLGDQLKTAVKKGVRFALILGEKELADEQYTLRNLENGTEERHGPQRIVSIVKDHRK